MHTQSPTLLKLTRAGTDDVHAITQLAETIWRVHYPSIIGNDQVEYMLKNLCSQDNVVEQMAKGQDFFFVDTDAIRIGYVAISFPAQEEMFIHKFYIDSEEQGRGVGKKVFANLLEQNPHVNSIRLTVNRKNYKSINFYFRLGFKIEEVKDFDIGEGYFMEDFVMIWVRR